MYTEHVPWKAMCCIIKQVSVSWKDKNHVDPRFSKYCPGNPWGPRDPSRRFIRSRLFSKYQDLFFLFYSHSLMSVQCGVFQRLTDLWYHKRLNEEVWNPVVFHEARHKEVYKNRSQSHSVHYFFLENKIIFHENVIYFKMLF